MSSDLVAREVNTKNNFADAYMNHQADALGNLRSFGDLFGGIKRGVAQDTGEVGQLGNFKKGSSGVKQLELDNANRASDAYKTWADLTGGLGKVALTAALAGRYDPAPGVDSTGAIIGAVGPTSVNGAPLVGVPARFGANATPFLTYGR